MKKMLIIIILLSFSVGIPLSADGSGNIFDINSRKLIRLVEEGHLEELDTKMYRRLPTMVDTRTGKKMTSMFIKVDRSQFNSASIEQLGGRVNSQIGKIITVRLPVTALPQLRNVPGIEWVELAKKVKPKLDISRDEIRATEVHDDQGDLGFTGEDVIVGVVDYGLDFDHPDFIDSNGSSRVAYLWDQPDDTSGSPPDGFSDGTLWTGADIDNETCVHLSEESHGTHVMGIAAGNGAGSPESADYTGIAPDANLIFINLGEYDDDDDFNTAVLDGINFIFQQADNSGLSAVVNLSLGITEGPHDGTSLFDQALDEMVGPGRIVVGASGNEGSLFVHANHTLDNNTGTFFLDYPAEVEVDIWGQPESDLQISLNVWDADGSGITIETPFFSSADVSEEYEADQYGYAIWSEINAQNDDEHFYIEWWADAGFAANVFWGITVTGSGEFDAYSGNGIDHDISDFESIYQLGHEWVPGDNNQSIGEVGGTANRIITVGAYTTRNNWTDHFGNSHDPCTTSCEIDEIADFSSMGPTRDGRIKPDITAPGQYIAAPLNQFSDEDSTGIVWLPNGSELRGGYLLLVGTSMASPHIVGVVSLMLEAYPSLTPEDIKQIFASTSRFDDYTGTELPNNIWGEGKVDAYAAVGSVVTWEIIDDEASVIPQAFRLKQNYPNPFNPTTTLKFDLPKATDMRITIYDILGREVIRLVDGHLDAGYHRVMWNGKTAIGQEASTGVYIVRMETAEFMCSIKIVMLK